MNVPRDADAVLRSLALTNISKFRRIKQNSMLKKITTFITATLLITSYSVAQQNDIEPDERQKIEQVIQEYLLENPEILEMAFRELQRRRINEQRIAMAETANNYRNYLENGDNAGVLGNPDGDVTIVEFFDYRCGFCKRHFAEVMRLVNEDKNIRWVARHFPILDRPDQPPVSRIAARAAIAATKQGKFREFHLEAMSTPGSFTEETVMKIAEVAGLDLAQLKADMSSSLTEKQITNSMAIGRDIGFTGTPGYVIGNTVLLGAEGYDKVKQAVARARQSK